MSNNKTQPDLAAYEILSHGFMLPDYFQGCGVAFTPFNSVVTGCGSSESEAFSDALDQMAENGASLSFVESLEANNKPSEEPIPEEYEESLYYVSVRYNSPEN